jgi:hypothetical protein
MGACLIAARFYTAAVTSKRLIRAEPARRRYRGTGSVAGKRRIAAEFDGHVIPLAGIESPSIQRQLFKVLTNTAHLLARPEPERLRPMNERVPAITGVGVISSLASSLEGHWQRVLQQATGGLWRRYPDQWFWFHLGLTGCITSPSAPPGASAGGSPQGTRRHRAARLELGRASGL